MDKPIEFKIKKTKKENILLVIKILRNNIQYNKKEKEDTIKEYINIVTKYEKLFVLVDTSAISYVSPKLLFEGATDLKHHDLQLKKTLRATGVIMTNKIMKTVIDKVLAITPVVTPTEFFTSPSEALEYIKKMEQN